MFIEIFKTALAALRSVLCSRAILLAENAVLRQQIIVLQRSVPVKSCGTRCLITPPRSPKANAICERLNGTLRRDCLDHIIVIDDVHAERVLKEYVRYYHGRPHRGLHMQPPIGARWLPPVRRVPSEDVVSRPVLGGLHHEYYARVA